MGTSSSDGRRMRERGQGVAAGLTETLEEGLASLREEALGAGPGGSAGWDARLEALGIDPGVEAERRRSALGGVPQVGGAPLQEYEQAVRAYCQAFQAWLEVLQPAACDPEEVAALERRLRNLPGREAEAYAAQVKMLVERISNPPKAG